MANDRSLQCLYIRKQNVNKCCISETSGMEYYPFYGTVSENCSMASKRNNSNCPNTDVSDSAYVIIFKNDQHKQKRRRKYKVLKYSKKELVSMINPVNCSKSITDEKTRRSYSMSNINSEEDRKSSHILKKSKSSVPAAKNTVSPFYNEYVVGNFCYKCKTPECVDPYASPAVRARLYECQLKVAQEKRPCSCDSDTLFEVMKGFYECYKFKDCENCGCILCGHLPCEHLEGLGRHSTGEITSKGPPNLERQKVKNCLIYIADHGVQLPDGRTKSQKELISEVKETLVKKRKALEQVLATGAACRSCKTPDCVNPLKNPAVRAKILDCLMRPAGANCCCSCNSEVIYKVMKGLYDCYASRDSEKCECILCGHLPCELTKSSKDFQTLDKIPLRDKPEVVKDRLLHCLIEIAKGELHLPVGRTESEEDLIEKARDYLKRKPRPKLDEATQSEKDEERMEGVKKKLKPLPDGMKKAKESKHVDFSHARPDTIEAMKTRSKVADKGNVTQLDGKTHLQKEKIVQSWKAKGIALPEGRTKSEKTIIDKIRKESPAQTPITVTKSKEKATMKDFSTPRVSKKKHEKAFLEGSKDLIRSFGDLKDKSPEEKEKILKDMLNQQLLLPEARTASEKKVIYKIKKEQVKSFTDLAGKTEKEKENILKSAAKLFIPLPKPKTLSEKKLIKDIKKQHPPPTFSTMRDKTPSEKETILKAKAKRKISLPEPKTKSEKTMVQQIQKVKQPPTFQDLKGKTPKEKENILKSIAYQNLPLPEPRTKSEKKLKEKVLKEMPPRSFSAVKDKTQEEKEKILKNIADQYLPLPKPKSPSERELVQKILKETLPVSFSKIKHKPPEEIKQILKDFAIPIAKTPSEKALMGKIFEDMPKAKTPSEKALVGKILDEIPKATTPSEKALVNKILQEMPPPTFAALKDRSSSEKEKILKAMAKHEVPLPEPKTASEKKLIDKVQKELTSSIQLDTKGKLTEEKEKVMRNLMQQNLPLPEPKTPSDKKIYDKVMKEMAPRSFSDFEGKSMEEKEKILKSIATKGGPLPKPKTESKKKLIDKIEQQKKRQREGKDKTTDAVKAETPSERKFIDKIKEDIPIPSFTALKNKSDKQKENILKSVAKKHFVLPKPRTDSEKKLLDKIKKELPIPSFTSLKDKTPSEKELYVKAMARQNLPLPQSKTPSEKELLKKVLQSTGKSAMKRSKAKEHIPLPEPRTSSEKEMIDELLKEKPSASEGRKTDEYGKPVDTQGVAPKVKIRPFSIMKDKTPAEKEKLLKILANQHIPLPEPKSPSEKMLVQKVMKETPPPTFSKIKQMPAEERDQLLKDYAKLNIQLPKPKTSSEKALADKLLLLIPPATFSSLKDRTPSEKNRILKLMAKENVPLPEPQTPSEKKMILKIQAEMPTLILDNLKGKSPKEKENILIQLANQNLPLPEPRSSSEKKLIDKILTETRPRSFSELKDKTPAEKERILKLIANQHLPLPEPKSRSEKKLVQKILLETPPPTFSDLRNKLPEEKEQILKDYAKYNLSLPEPKTPSEKALVEKIFIEMPPPTFAGLKDRKPSEKERILKMMLNQNIALPEPKTKSEKQLILKIQAEVPQTTFQDLKGKSPKDKEKLLIQLANQNLPLPEPRSPSEKKILDKVLIELRPRSFAALRDKTPAEKERLLRIIAKQHLPLPEPKTQSEKKLVQKILLDIAPPAFSDLRHRLPEEKEQILRDYAKYNLPLPEPKTPSEEAMVEKIIIEMPPPTFAALNVKKPSEKERIIKIMLNQNIPLPEPKTKSDKQLILKIQAEMPPTTFQELKGKSPEDKEKILIQLANQNFSLPEPRSPSEKKILDKVLIDLRPRSFAAFNDKKPAEKERILKIIANQHLPLPEPRSQSEKKLVQKILLEIPPPTFSDLKNRLPVEKEQILKDYAKYSIPLPEPKTSSEKALFEKIILEMPPPTFAALKERKPSEKERILKMFLTQNVPLPEPKTTSEKQLIQKIQIQMPPPTFQALKGRSDREKEKILKAIANQYLPLPEARTPSERKLLDKVLTDTRPQSFSVLKDKTSAEKEQILKILANQYLPLPEPKSQSEKKLVQKVLLETPPPTFSELNRRPLQEREQILKEYAKHHIQLPETRTLSENVLLEKIRKDLPPTTFKDLKGRSSEDKEKILKAIANQYSSLPRPRTPSEKQLYEKVVKETRLRSFSLLKNKTLDEKEAILKKIAEKHLPLPEPKSPSEKKLVQKILKGTPAPTFSELKHRSLEEKEQTLKQYARYHASLPKAKTPSEKALLDKIFKEMPPPTFAALKDRTASEKERILKTMAKQNVPLPKPKSASEKKLIDKLQKESVPSAYLDLKGKTSEEKEKTMRNLLKQNLQLPVPKTSSEKKIYDKVMKQMAPQSFSDLNGKTPEEMEKTMRNLLKQNLQLPVPKTSSEKKIYDKIMKQMASHSFSDLKGETPEEMEKILKNIASQGIPLPKPKTESQKRLIEKIQKQVKERKGEKHIAESPSEQKFIDKVKNEIAIPSFTTLKNKSNKEKEEIIKKIAKKHFILPKPRTDSEKLLVDKIKKELPIPSFTSLKDKTPSEKELYIKAMVRQKLPLPQPKTKSEKELLKKLFVSTETSAMKRSKAQQHIPLPERKTSSERKMIEKLLKEVPPPSEGERKAKGGKLIESKRADTKIKAASDIDAARRLKISQKHRTSESTRKKATKIGLSRSEIAGKSADARGFEKKKSIMAKGFAAQQINEITTKTKCDRACGCDKKKIKFKDSYIKIRVTSPDLASLCPCPEDPPCLTTGLPSGVIVNDDGIVVTIASALCAPPFRYQNVDSNPQSYSMKNKKNHYSPTYFNEIFQENHNLIYRNNNISDESFVKKNKEYTSCTILCHSSLHYLSARSSHRSLNIKKSETVESFSISSSNSGIETVSTNNSDEIILSPSSENTIYPKYDDCNKTGSLQSNDRENLLANSYNVNSKCDKDWITLLKNEKVTVLQILNSKKATKEEKNNAKTGIDISKESEINDIYCKKVLQNSNKTFQISDGCSHENSFKILKTSSSTNESLDKGTDRSVRSLNNSDLNCSEKVLAINSFRHYLERDPVSSSKIVTERNNNDTELAQEIVDNKLKEKQDLSVSGLVLVDSSQEYTKIVNELLQNERISDSSSIFLLIPLDDQDTEDSIDTCRSQLFQQYSEKNSDQSFFRDSVADMVDNSTQAGQAYNAYPVRSKHQVLYQDRWHRHRWRPEYPSCNRISTSGNQLKSSDDNSTRSRPEDGQNSPMLYSAMRGHRTSRRQVAMNRGSFNPANSYNVESGYTYPQHQELRKDFDTYEASHSRRRIRPSPPGFTFTRLPKDAVARAKVPAYEAPEWEKEPWRDHWRTHQRRPEDPSYTRVLLSGNLQTSSDDNNNQQDDQGGRPACAGCMSRGRQSQQPSPHSDKRHEGQGSSPPDTTEKKRSFLARFRRKDHSSSRSSVKTQDSYTMYEIVTDSEEDGDEGGDNVHEANVQEDSKPSFLTSMFRGRKVWRSKSTPKLQSSFTSTHSYMVIGRDQETLCRGTEFEDIQPTSSCNTGQPSLLIALAPNAETSESQLDNQNLWRGIYDDITKTDKRIPADPNQDDYHNNRTTTPRHEDDSSRYYRDYEIGPHELLGYWESSSDSGLIPFPRNVVVDRANAGGSAMGSVGGCGSKGCGSTCGRFPPGKGCQHMQTDTTVDRPCGCAIEKKPCDTVIQNENGKIVDPGCGSVLLTQSGCHKKHKCAAKKNLQSDIDIECQRGSVQQVVHKKAHECAKPPEPKKKKEKPPPPPKWKPQMAVYGGEQIKLQTRRRMRNPYECCSSHEGIYKSFPSCQSLTRSTTPYLSVTGCRAKEFIKLSNVTPVDRYHRTTSRRKLYPAMKGCWNARSPTGSSRHLRSIGFVRECDPRSPWSGKSSHEDSCSCDSGTLHHPYEHKRVQLNGLKPPISKTRNRPRRGYLMKLNSVVSQTISGFELMLGKDVVRYQQKKFYEECISCVCDGKKKKSINVKKFYRHFIPEHTVECKCEPEPLKVGGKGFKVKIDAKGIAEMPQACIELGSSLQKLCSLMCNEGSEGRVPKEKEPPRATSITTETTTTTKTATTFKEKMARKLKKSD